MQRFLRKLSGFSLFEVMLVLVVASMIAVAGLKYAKSQQETTADQLYGNNLYTYGQAVQQYINDAKLSSAQIFLPGPDMGGTRNKEYATGNITETQSTNTGITATGVAWLKQANAGKKYLDDNFSFATNMSPLIISVPDNSGAATAVVGDQAIVTHISIPGSGNAAPTISVSVGVLYEPGSGTDPNTHQPLPPVPKPGLTQEAITHANTMYDAYHGAPAIQYGYPYVDPNTHALTPGAQITGAVNLTGGNNQYLRLDGTSTMVGDINFDPSMTNNINQVNGITFLTPPLVTSGIYSQNTISNIDQVTFANDSSGNAMGQIFNLGLLRFGTRNSPDGGPPGIRFDGSPGYIQNVVEIDGVKTLSFNQQGQTCYPAVTTPAIPAHWAATPSGLSHGATDSQCGNGNYRNNIMHFGYCQLVPLVPAVNTPAHCVADPLSPKSSINGLDTLTFTGAGSSISALTTISGLTTILFSNGAYFTGFRPLALDNTGRPGQAGTSDTNANNLTVGGAALNATNAICTVAHTQGAGGCHVLINNGVWQVSWKNEISCEAQCYGFW